MTDEIWEIIFCADQRCSERRYEAGRKAYRRAVRLSAAAGVPRLGALAAERLVRIDMLERRHRDALRGIELAIGLWEQLGELGSRAQALRKKAEILVQMHRMFDARLAWREARAALRDHGDSYGVLHCDAAIEDIGARIRAQARAERRARAGSDPSRRSVLSRRWPR